MRSAMRLASLPMLVGLLMVWPLGCGPSHPDAIPVTVTIKHNGKPIQGATVNFISDDGSTWMAYGTTDAQGKCQLSTYGENDGAVAGKHKVSVVKNAKNPAFSEEDASPNTPRTINLLPKKYEDFTRSRLLAEVSSDKTDFTFELQGKIIELPAEDE